MIKRIISVFVVTACFSSSAIAAICNYTNMQMWSTYYFYGPTIANAVANNANVATAINNGRDAWDVTNAANIIIGHNGGTASSDCPATAQTTIVGAFAFTGSSCATNAAYPISVNALGYADIDWAGCSICNTRSIVVNLNYTWVVNGAPLTGQYDVRSFVAHEFGHSLGMMHQAGGVCNPSNVNAWCSTTPGKETMHPSLADGDVCQGDLTAADEESADAYYP